MGHASNTASLWRRCERATALLVVAALAAAACSSDGGPTPSADENDASHAIGTPLLDIDDDTTWSQMTATVAGSDEASCARGASEDAGVGGLLDTSVLESGDFDGWPIISAEKEVLTVSVDGYRWPHEVWRCLSRRNTTAVYLSALIQEQGVDIAAMTGEDRACIARLPQDEALAKTAASVLNSEQEFVVPDVGEFMAELDAATEGRLFWCLSEFAIAVLDPVIDLEFGLTLNDAELECMVDAALAAARRPDVDLDALYRTVVTDEFPVDEDNVDEIRSILAAGAGDCLSEGAGGDAAGPVGDGSDGPQGDKVGQRDAGAGSTGVWEGTVDASWGDLLGRYADGETACIIETLGNDTVEMWLDLPLLTEADEDEFFAWLLGVTGCLELESAAYTVVLLLAVESERAFDRPLDPADGECLRSAFSEFDVLAVWGFGDDEGDFSALNDSYEAAVLGCLRGEWVESLLGDTASAEPLWLWETVTNSDGHPVAVSPVVWGGVVVARDYSGAVHALDSASGETLWALELDDDIAAPVAIDDGIVLVTGPSAHYALDALSGELVWQSPNSEHRQGPPAVARDQAYFSASGARPNSAIVAVDMATGAELWKTEVRSSDLPLLFPLMVNNFTLYVSDDRMIHAVDGFDGTILWSVETMPGAQPHLWSHTVGVMGTVDATDGADGEAPPVSCLRGTGAGYCPMAVDTATGATLWYWDHAEALYGHADLIASLGGVFLIADDGLHAVEMRTGEVLWSAPYTSLTGAPLGDVFVLYVVDLWDGLVALDAADGAELWRLPDVDVSPDTMVLFGNVLYAASSTRQEIYAVNTFTGELLWAVPAVVTGGERTFAVEDGALFAGFQDAEAGGVQALLAPVAVEP